MVVGLGSNTAIQGMSLSTGATNLVGRFAETNDQIKFVFTDTEFKTLIGNNKNLSSWDVKLEQQVVAGNTLSGDLVLYALVVGDTVPVKVSTVHVSWDNSSGLDLANYKLAAFALESSGKTAGTWDISTGLRLTSNTEILDTDAQVGLIGSSGTDNVVLSAQVTEDVGAVKGNADVGAQVVVAGLGSDNYITRVQGMTYDDAGRVMQQVSTAYDVNKWTDYQTILDMGSVSDKTQVDTVVIEGVRNLGDLNLERVELVGEGKNSLHIEYDQYAQNTNGSSSLFATGHLQIFSQMSEWSPQYHIEKLQIVEQSNALDITKAAKTYFFGEQTQTFKDDSPSHNVTGYQVEGDASRDTLLIGSSGIDKFVVNGIDSANGKDMWLYGADFQADGNSPSDNLTLKFKEAGFLQNITDADGTVKGDFAVDSLNGGFIGAGGLVHVDITNQTLGTSGNTATKATITMRDGSVNETSLSLFFADGGNVDSTFLNKIKWES